MNFDKLAVSPLFSIPVIRVVIRFLLKKKLKLESKKFRQNGGSYSFIVKQLSQGHIAENVEDANDQHYEIPPEYYHLVLGPYLKYSSGLWNKDTLDLEQSEYDMLNLVAERAQIKDGMNILDLGCGWGSLTLFIAKHFPNCSITSMSNSDSQIAYIQSKANDHGYNVKAVKCDVNDAEFEQKFDRVLSIEMFEHIRNYQKILKKVSRWLNNNGLLFIHIFGHKKFTYFFENISQTDFIARHFFSGGYMPTEKIISYFQDELKILNHWRVNGSNYHKTCEAWLKNHVQQKKEVIELFKEVYGESQAKKWWHMWKLFYLACSELFKFNNGNEWMVFHYLLKKNDLKFSLKLK